MNYFFKKSLSQMLSLALLLFLTIPAFADHLVNVPVGTVIPLKMDSHLSSESSRVGDRFTATVSRDVTIDGQVVIPANSKVEGHVTNATPSDRTSKAGTIAIAFDRLTLSNGPAIPVDGTLTPLSEEARRELDRDSVDGEDRVGGGSRTRRAVVFIGGGAGAGAVIGAVAGGAKGAAVGAGIGAVLGTIGVLLSKGQKAEVESGAEFGMMVESSFTVNTDTFGVSGDRYDNNQSSSDYDPIRRAQVRLRDRGFYNGPINGEMTVATRNAIRDFQRDRNLTITGDLDARTAQELGIPANQDNSPQAGLATQDTIRAAQLALRDRGFYNGPVNGQMTASTQDAIRAFQRARNLSVNGDLDVSTRRELRILSDGRRDDGRTNDDRIGSGVGTGSGIGTGSSGGTAIGNPRQLFFLANRLFQDYQRDLNIRNTRGQVVFDASRNFKENEVEVLFQLAALRAAAELYSQMAVNVTDSNALKGAADSLLRQVRLTYRAIRRNPNVSLSSIVMNDWDQLRAEVRNITVTDNNLDTDAIR